MRDVPQSALSLIKRFEGLRLQPYRDCAGFPTIGYGHLLSRDHAADMTKFSAITAEEADDLLDRDVAAAAHAVLQLIKVPLSDARYGALVSFAFNCGPGNLQVSTLRRKANREEHADVPAEFGKWVYARGMKLPGLVRRRAAEAALYASG